MMPKDKPKVTKRHWARQGNAK